MNSIFLKNLHYFFSKLDGTYAIPNNAIGDLLRQAKKELEDIEAKTEPPKELNRMASGLNMVNVIGTVEILNKKTGKYESLSDASDRLVSFDTSDEVDSMSITMEADISGSMTCKINKRAYRKLMRALRKMAREEK